LCLASIRGVGKKEKEKKKAPRKKHSEVHKSEMKNQV